MNNQVNMLSLPQPIIENITKLNEMVQENPLYIPLPIVASFLGANAEGLRSCIEKGQCPFGLAWQKEVRGNKGFKIPTVPFYLWYTQGAGYRN